MGSTSIFKTLILLSFVINTFCYVYLIPSEMGKSEDHEGFCYFNSSDSLIKQGESIILQSCEEVSCWDDYTIQVMGCGLFSIEDPSCLQWERDYTKPYPDCCNTFNCVKFAETEFVSIEPDENTLEGVEVED